MCGFSGLPPPDALTSLMVANEETVGTCGLRVYEQGLGSQTSTSRTESVGQVPSWLPALKPHYGSEFPKPHFGFEFPKVL